MDFLKRLFRNEAATPPLPPLQDAVLGTLQWNQDSEGWVADLPSATGSATLYIGAGSENQYPGEPLLALVREPFRSYDEHCRRAFAYLEKNVNFSDWNVQPQQLTPAGIQTFEHYLARRTYTIVFNAPDGALWKVHFCDGSPTGSGVDD